MELSADHSPESHTEFARMHRFRPHAALAHHPELLFVYDTLTASKLACPPIFELDARNGRLAKTERGSYYKNVRCEWATLVATPPHAPFQDALAFTRSLGDLHLQTYGVSHTPETWWMDLTVRLPAFSSVGSASSAGTGSPSGTARFNERGGAGTGSIGDATDGATGAAGSAAAAGASGGAGSAPGSTSAAGGEREAPLVATPLALVLCSDGIWDNWKFEEVAAFALQHSRVAEVLRSGSAQAATNDLMTANLERARVNFGNSADNMTSITLYFVPRRQ
jgi:serine/threonine protein phosphatase PrpC